MLSITVYPNAKINLGLYVTQKRSDGFHDIETVFLPVVGLYDTLEIAEVNTTSASLSLEVCGNRELACEPNNILERAYELLVPFEPPKLRVRLTKRIPTGAGLGGGSADASFFLQAVAPFCKQDIAVKQLESLALQLGSDCPFFLRNTPSIGCGRGEKLIPIALKLSGYYLLVVVPPIHIATKEAFAAITPQLPQKALKETLLHPVEEWGSSLYNDFQAYVVKQYPLVGSLLASLRERGAVYTSLSGSGSALFGLYRQLPELPNLPNCLVHLECL
ncbi:MAG: 4-(cytidine 5'-diphospho)-2-C-methyl-D-erythritol kinase [Bacteroides sp.]